MDNVKAFDGLFIQPYEHGIKNKLFRTIINAYTNMHNTILYSGIQSTTFQLLQSVRQGSFWGTFFYLVLINPLLTEMRDKNVGAYMSDIFSGVHAQADDVALLSITRAGLQIMMDSCYKFACKWRFKIHPEKSKVIIWGESKHSPILQKWYIGYYTVDKVESHTHCGVLLSSASSTVQRTKIACRKGRGTMASICTNGVLCGNKMINPITCLKLYKTIAVTSALYGCEVWSNLCGTEKLMLERFQRFCAKLIQRLPRRTRSNICCKMIGLQSIESYMDSMKLKFFRRLAVLPSPCISKQIFLRRLFQAEYLQDIITGFGSEILVLLKKYNLEEFRENYIRHGYFPDKQVWKKIVCRHVSEAEMKIYDNITQDDIDFERFRRIHPDIQKPSPIWRVAREFPSMLAKCYNVAKLIACPPSNEAYLCEFCGYVFKDKIVHYCCNCSYTNEERNTFWDIINNSLSIEAASNLYNVSDDEFVDIVLGRPFPLISNYKEHVSFLVISINFLHKLLDKVEMT